MSGSIESASLGSGDAADAGEVAGKFICRICGKPAERKRRRDHSWFYYDRCRRCRRETAGGKTAPGRIRDGRLLYLIEILEEHLLTVKAAGWENAPKAAVAQRLKTLIDLARD